jgi:cysteinyl-tRNA synthetase, unknown class
MRGQRLPIFVTLLAIVLASAAHAQVQGQGRVIEQEQRIAPPAIPGQGLRDLREEMRDLVLSIRSFALRHRQDFGVIAMNGLELLTKADPLDDTKRVPASTYMRSLSGVLQEALFFGYPEVDAPRDEKLLETLLQYTEMAKARRLKVLVMDYVPSAKRVTESIRLNLKHGYIPFPAPARGLDLAGLPRLPSRPVNENPNSILTPNEVRNFVMIRDPSRLGRQDEFAFKVHDTNYDLVVVEPFHTIDTPLGRQAVETLKYKKLGARRLVYAYVNIGIAASHRYYWQPNWREGSPLWISAPVPGDPDSYFIEFWRPEWQQIITGNTDSFIYGIVMQGYDGAVLDGIDTFLFHEGGTEAWLAAR